MFQSLDALANYSAAIFEQRNSNQVSLFGEAGDDLPEPRLSPTEDWLPNERLAEENLAIGFYLSGHPLDDYAVQLKRRKDTLTLLELQEKAEREGGALARVGVIVSAVQDRKSGRGTRYFRMNASDPTGQLSGMVLFPEDFERTRAVLDETAEVVMLIEGRLNEGQYDPMARSLAPLESVISAGVSAGLNVMIDEVEAVPMIQSVLERFRDDGSIKSKGPIKITALDVPLPDAPQDVEIHIGAAWPVSPQIKGALKSLPGVVLVEDA